jgi:hypothetical protein
MGGTSEPTIVIEDHNTSGAGSYAATFTDIAYGDLTVYDRCGGFEVIVP